MIGCGVAVGVSRPRGLERAIRAALFGSGEVGVMYDPSDLTSMFQDSAGTTAAVVGQPVGLVLDKSQGLVLGPELVTNGTFDTDTGWTKSGGWVISGGSATHPTGLAGSLTQSIALVAGKTYDVNFDVSAITGTGSVSLTGGTIVSYTFTTAGHHNVRLTALSGNVNISSYFGAVSSVTIDNISVRELPGYHATQSTGPARGILGTSLIDLDGVDDALSAAAGGGGSTGFFLCAACRVDGGAGTERVIYSDAGTNTGYILRLNTSNQLELAAGNGTAYTLAATTDTLTAGPYVVTAWDDGTNLNVQVNSGTAGTAARPVVSAGNAGFRIGKDYGAATGYFNGAIYPLVYVKNGQNVDAADRAAVKTYIAGKAGVTL